MHVVTTPCWTSSLQLFWSAWRINCLPVFSALSTSSLLCCPVVIATNTTLRPLFTHRAGRAARPAVLVAPCTDSRKLPTLGSSRDKLAVLLLCNILHSIDILRCMQFGGDFSKIIIIAVQSLHAVVALFSFLLPAFWPAFCDLAHAVQAAERQKSRCL